MKKIFAWIPAILFLLVFTLKPFPASDLILRVHFDDITGDYCALYYAVDGQDFVAEQSIRADIDPDRMLAEFQLDGSLAGRITSLRLDWPHGTEQLLCVKNISISSGGIIQKQYNPCRFFADGNISLSNGIASTTNVLPRDRTYIQIGPDDPWQVLSGPLTEDICSSFSRRTFSRLCLCLFFVCSVLLAKKRLFT